MRSFADHSTHFLLETSSTTVGQDGCRKGEPTGRVFCMECWRAHPNVDEIPHSASCSQRFVHSRWYADSMDAD